MTDKITETGCYLDNHRGHYISRDTIQFAEEFGFIMGPFEQYAVSMYDAAQGGMSEVDYPQEALIELCDEAVAWLNSGQSNCETCRGTGKDVYGWTDKDGVRRCKSCTGTGRGDRIKGQNYPPVIPEGTHWAFEDGDFGLWYYDDDGNVVDADTIGMIPPKF